ncbi:hypothetical protein EJ02DRAFT_427109 [Clathrospora elynae]|uniref:BTB domain-containing protein n=1 Tax=Clathrospora elynae TaxID=706981 RepID=A0A6A5SAS0_9PLEO|nr:hypothetical protein EJ02DRAFT_427109 [Clathrospora elynae]
MTPPETPSRTSNVPIDNIERSTPASDDFKPLQLLMETTISSLEQLLVKGKNLREQYTKSNGLRGQLTAYVFLEVTEKEFEDSSLEEKSLGVHAVAREMFGKLHQINKKEIIRAKKEPVRAQRPLLLPSAEETTVHFFAQWIYRGPLYCQDAEQLYALLKLGDQLGADTLTETCTSNLFNAASDGI